MIHCRKLILLALLSFAMFVPWLEFGLEGTMEVLGLENHEGPSNTRETISEVVLIPNQNDQNFLKRPSGKTLNNYDTRQPAKALTDVAQKQRIMPMLFRRKTLLVWKTSSPARKIQISLSPERAKSERKGILNKDDSVGNAITYQHNLPSQVSLEDSIKTIQPTFGNSAYKNVPVLRVLEIAYFRSGSSFLGDILQAAYPKTFYHFEPLNSTSDHQRIKQFQLDEAYEIINLALRCKFTNLNVQINDEISVHKNKFLWSSCGTNITRCFDPDHLCALCKEAEIQVMKLARFPMNRLQDFLKKNEDLNIKVVYLVRDPRGIISSRKSRDWCTKTNCSNRKTLCQEMLEDVKAFKKMQQERPERFIRVFYERLALNTSSEVKALYKALGMPFTPAVEDFIWRHTHVSVNEIYDPYSTRRNSSDNTFKWRHGLSFEEVEAIQKDCSAVMDALGYLNLKSRKDLLDVRIPVLSQSSVI